MIHVSVIIPAYNAEEYIGRALDSVLTQSAPADEIIVVDDGSTDKTAEIVKAFGQRVRYIYQDNAGVSVARNRGIEEASGNWIAFLDADDEWLPNKLKQQVDVLRRNPHLVWVGGNYIRCLCNENQQGKIIEVDKALALLGGRDYFDNPVDAWLQRAKICTPVMLIKKCVFQEVGLFQIGLQHSEDVDLWWRIVYRYQTIGYVAEPLAICHLNTPGSLSQGLRPKTIFTDLLRRHLKLATSYGQLEIFQPLARFMITHWLRNALFDASNAQNIRCILKEFGWLLPWRFKTIIRTLMLCPGITAWACCLISRICRRYNLRGFVGRRPLQKSEIRGQEKV